MCVCVCSEWRWRRCLQCRISKRLPKTATRVSDRWSLTRTHTFTIILHSSGERVQVSVFFCVLFVCVCLVRSSHSCGNIKVVRDSKRQCRFWFLDTLDTRVATFFWFVFNDRPFDRGSVMRLLLIVTTFVDQHTPALTEREQCFAFQL